MICSAYSLVASAIHEAFEPWEDLEDMALIWDAHMKEVAVPCLHEPVCDGLDEMEDADTGERHSVHVTQGVHVHLLMGRTGSGVSSSMGLTASLAHVTGGDLAKTLTQVREEFEFALHAGDMSDFDASMKAIADEYQNQQG